MSTLMTERRRPLENDDGQGALFGGEAFAPAGPAPAWQRHAHRDAAAAPSGGEAGADGSPTAATAPGASEARVDADSAAPSRSEPAGDTSPASGAFEARVDADAATPDGFEPGAGPAAARALDPGSAAPAGTPSPFADEIAELERATDSRSPRSPRAPLAGPTLDDVMSRVWEGLATGLPVACPVCHAEVVPAISGPPRGRCTSCGTTID